MAKNKEEIITLEPIHFTTINVTIRGTSDLTLNKMNDVTVRELTDARKDKAKSTKKANVWEEVITSMHWHNPLSQCGIGDPEEWTKETLDFLLKVNKPCISAFGLYKSFGEAVVRNEIDTYATKFNATVTIEAEANLIPIEFKNHALDEKLMQPKRGAPVLARINRFTDWSATFTLRFIEGGKYSLVQIVSIINLAGFGGGIGSGRRSGYGRYEVISVDIIKQY